MLHRIEGGAVCAVRRGRRFLERLEARESVRMGIFCAVLFLAAATLFALNRSTPLMMDDYDYSFSWSTGERISGPADVMASQAAHYRLWGGRSVVHAVAQFFLSLNKRVFDVANTVMYVLLLLELYVLARPKGRRWCWTLPLIAHAVLMTCVPFFGTVFLWLTGACNYLWGTVLALIPLLVLKSGMEGGFFSKGYCGWLALPLCFAAGWTNENTACGVLALSALILIGIRVRGNRVRAWQWAALAAQAAGTAVMLLAPGNFARASAYAYDNLIVELLRRVVMATAYGVLYVGVLLAAAVLLHGLGRALGVRLRTGRAALLLLGGALAAYAMVASPVFSDRSWTGVIMLALCAVLVHVGDIEAQVRGLDGAKLLALPLVVLVLAAGGYQALGDVAAHGEAWLEQVARIEAAAAAGEESVSVEGVESHSRYTMDISIAQDAETWPNSTLSRTFGIRVNGL